MQKTIDLHIHTNVSDGEFSPKEIIGLAHKNGVKIISITDHDTVGAYTEELINYAKSKNIKIINGVEISTKSEKVGIHVLGYNFDINNEKLLQKLNTLRNARHDYLFNVGNKLNELGYFLNVEELDKIEAVTKAHIALDVINNPINEELLLKEFNHIPSKGEFIETIMNEGCPAYVVKETITPSVASSLIKEAGGKVVLAHPVAYFYEDNLTEEDITLLVEEMKPDGIESNYIYVDRYDIKRNDIKKWNKLAEKLNLFTTIGSDFHNFDGLRPKIGLINEEIDLTVKEIDKIINNLEI